MANYYASARSNYFAVKSEDDFKAFCERWNLEYISRKNHDDRILHGFLVTEGDGNLPIYLEVTNDDGTKEEIGFDQFVDELAEMLPDDEVAIIMEVGNEKLRYLAGFAMAINSKKKHIMVDLNTIYDLVEVATSKAVTRCEY
ncbi:hypothetical protein [Acinetobacter sp.]|uniref:hypothetical protein n=1 Tax=Acinetobacter sp. TaxID=472 RepID=UPI003D024F48